MNACSSLSSSPPPPDAELARAAQRGEKRAFVEIVARHQVMVCGVALGVLGDFAASEDAAQEAFVTAWRKIHELREPEKLKGWLAQIARNAALGHLRRRRGAAFEEVDEDQPDENQPLPDQEAARGEECALVQQALARLPEMYRLPLVLFYRQDQSVREVAETLHLSEQAVKQRLSRGRELLRERVGGLIEITLRHTRPGAVFTVAIAAAIGALTAPPVLAGTAFAAAAAAGSVAAAAAGGSSAAGTTLTTSATATVMTTSKASFAMAALAAFACLPVGYAVHRGTHPLLPPPGEEPVEKKAAGPRSAGAGFKPDFGTSGLFAEWQRLHEEHGHDAAAMPALFKAIAGIPDSFRRRAFRAALISEWAELDPAGGLSFLLGQGGDRVQCRQLFQEWLARDPQAAVAALAGLGSRGHTLAAEPEILKEIARRAPEHVAALAAGLPENRNYWEHPVAEAFAILAAADPDAARAAAETLSGARRAEALSGVAEAWGRKDFQAAAAWAKNLPEGTDREAVLRSALLGLAAADPRAALENVALVPPGGRPGYFADTTAAKLLRKAGEKDFEGTAAWLRDHPGRISGEDTTGLSGAVTARLNADPAKFLDQALKDGTLEALNGALSSALLNDSKPQQAKVWEWLKKQPADSPSLAGLRDTLLNSAGWQNPELTLTIARELPDTPEGRQSLERLSQSILNGGSRMSQLEKLLPDVPGPMRPTLIMTGFGYLEPDNLGSAAQWLPRLEEVPAGLRPAATQRLAQAWAGKAPGEAAAWTRTLPPENRADIVGTVAAGWLKRDSLAASEWIASLPSGPDRDAGAGKLVEEVADDSPGEAWQWALSISGPGQRMSAASRALAAAARQNPQEAQLWIERSTLTEPEKQQLRETVTAGAAAPPASGSSSTPP